MEQVVARDERRVARQHGVRGAVAGPLPDPPRPAAGDQLATVLEDRVHARIVDVAAERAQEPAVAPPQLARDRSGRDAAAEGAERPPQLARDVRPGGDPAREDVVEDREALVPGGGGQALVI